MLIEPGPYLTSAGGLRKKKNVSELSSEDSVTWGLCTLYTEITGIP